jgi:N-acetylmuramoyl-L-alanine amidase
MDGGQIGAYQEKDDVLNVISANWDSFQTAAIEKG